LAASLARTEKEHFANSQEIDAAQPTLLKSEKAREAAKIALQACEEGVAEGKEAYTAARKRHGSADAVRLAIEDFGRCSKLESEKTELLKDIDAREIQRETVKDRMVGAEKAEKTARESWEEAKRKLEELRQLHAVDDIRRRLTKGLPCPVCEQVVSTVPKPEK